MNDISEVVVALIKNDAGKYLLINLANYYPSYDQHKDEWCPIAGHIRLGETAKQALIRESHEELAIEIEPIRQIARWGQDIPGETTVWWEVKIKSGEIKPNKKEVAKWGFFSAEEAKNLKLWPATRKFFDKFIW